MSLPTGPRKSELLAGIDGKQLGPALEQELNRHFGFGSPAYVMLGQLLKAGIEEQWAAYTQIDGPAYRRGRIAEPSGRTPWRSQCGDADRRRAAPT